MKKKHLSKILLTALLVLTLIFSSTGAVAAEGLILKAAAIKGNPGEQAVVAITVENASGSEGGQFILNFNPALVRPVAVEGGDLVTEATGALYMANLDYAPGQLIFMWVTAAADTANSGEVCRIIFDLLTEGASKLEFTEVIVAPDGLETGRMVSGSIAVGDTEVDWDESEEDSGQDENDEPVTEEEEEAAENGEEEEPTEELPIETESRSIIWIVIINLLVAAAIVGYLIIRRNKKTWSKQTK